MQYARRGIAVTAAGLAYLVPATGQRVPVRVQLDYLMGDPYAVQLSVRNGRAGWVRWLMARDLLALGLHGPVGEGDVRVRPDDAADEVLVELSSVNGHAVLAFWRRDLAVLVADIFEAVPAGSESEQINWQLEWSRLSGPAGEVA